MHIEHLGLIAKDLRSQQNFYTHTLELPADLSADRLEIGTGKTTLIFTQADPGFDGAYHFAFNIPENQFHAAKEWIASRTALIRDDKGNDEFNSSSWNATSLYFEDPAGNILEFIARHALKNAAEEGFNSSQILNVSEIGLPSEDVIGFANELCAKLNISVFHQALNEKFTPVGDDDGLLILPVVDRIWYPNTGVPARLLPVRVELESDDRQWEIRGVPYHITAK